MESTQNKFEDLFSQITSLCYTRELTINDLKDKYLDCQNANISFDVYNSIEEYHQLHNKFQKGIIVIRQAALGERFGEIYTAYSSDNIPETYKSIYSHPIGLDNDTTGSEACKEIICRFRAQMY